MTKYYALVTIGAMWAALNESILLLGLTTGVVVLLMMQDNKI